MRIDEAKAEAGANQAGVPAPDIPLQPSFDADNNTHRYRYMEPSPDAAICRCFLSPLQLPACCFFLCCCNTLVVSALHANGLVQSDYLIWCCQKP